MKQFYLVSEQNRTTASLKIYVWFLIFEIFRFLIPIYTVFFISNTFISNARLKLTKNHSTPCGWTFAIWKSFAFFSSTLSSKNNRRYSKKCTKNKYVCLKEAIWLMTMKMRLKMKNRSHRYNINRPRPKHGHTYTEYKIRLSIMMTIGIKQHLSNIWSSIHEKVKQHWGWAKKSVAYKKNVYLSRFGHSYVYTCSEAYSEPWQGSKAERLAKIVSCSQRRI